MTKSLIQPISAMITKKSTLKQLLYAECMAAGLDVEQSSGMIASVPEPLICAEAFLDKLTGLWRYDFGIPHIIGNTQYFGTHMWVPVTHLFMALRYTNERLPEIKRNAYLARLADISKHHAVLAEMIPALKIDPAMHLEFEVEGLGVGNRSVDWVIQSGSGQAVLIDVKRRVFDFISSGGKYGN
jgi:hypothetical protein